MRSLDNALKLLYKQGTGSIGYAPARKPFSMLLKTSFGEQLWRITHKCSVTVFFINGHTTWKANLLWNILKRLTADRKFYLQMLNAFLHHSSTFSNCLPSALNSSQPNYPSRFDLSAREYFFCGKAIVISHIRWLIKFSPLKGWLVSWCQ